MPPLEQIQYRFRCGHPVHYPRLPKPASVCTRARDPRPAVCARALLEPAETWLRLALSNLPPLWPSRDARLANAGNGVIRSHADTMASLRLGINAVRIGETAARFYRFGDLLQFFSAGERENCIHILRCELLKRGREIPVVPVYGSMGTETAHQRDTVFTGRDAQHPRVAQFGELDS